MDPGEMCDDGDKDETDACLNDCTPASCGDGKVQAGVETCDDGNKDETDACLNSCTPTGCGDGKVQAGVETCDDGNKDETDTCLNNCTPASCGDAKVQAGIETCDDGNKDETDTCLNNCTSASCGDAKVQTGVEECDDGKNGINTDACTDVCKNAACGDTFVQAGEQCDDGNLDDTDACTQECKTAACGDGIVQVGEECDDGNAMDTGDACPNSCFIDRRVFLTSQAFCGNMNGYADGLCNGSALGVDVTGVARGDVRCNAAKSARDGFTFRAWLSDGQNSPSARFKAATKGFGGRYVLLDGKTIVASGWKDLVDGSVGAIKITDKNAEFTPAVVWTNTKPDGSLSNGAHCAGWQSIANVQAGYGKNDGLGNAWTDNASLADCLNPGRLYCFEDPTD